MLASIRTILFRYIYGRNLSSSPSCLGLGVTNWLTVTKYTLHKRQWIFSVLRRFPQSLKDFYQIDNDYVCLRSVSCPKYCLCLCVVHSRFSPLFFPTFFLFKQFWMSLQGISNPMSYIHNMHTCIWCSKIV